MEIITSLMSFHVIHIVQHGSTLGKDRGFLTCRTPAGLGLPDRRMPLEDIRAVIIAARGVTLTSSAIGALLDAEAIVLHCNEKYQPCGLTAPLPRIIDTRTFLSQTSRPARLNLAIWKRLLISKTLNQQAVLGRLRSFSAYLDRALKSRKIDEGNCARKYWQLYFPSIGWGGTSRDRKLDTPPNRMLNYGYTVLATLCHRALLVHGLNPLIGVGHLPRYRSAPLVYDLMEPYRPFVDAMLAEFMSGSQISDEKWARYIAAQLREQRVHHERFSLKLMDALDKSASTLARCYANGCAESLWVPVLAA
jgi:CRISPR-associated protein Cas1